MFNRKHSFRILTALLGLAAAGCTSLATKVDRLDQARALDEARNASYGLPFPEAWNAIYRALRQEAPLVEADSDLGRLRTDWSYSVHEANARRTESRTRTTVSFRSRKPVAIHPTREAEVRITDLYESPGAWLPQGISTSEAILAFHQLLVQLEDGQAGELEFAVPAARLWPQVMELVSLDYGISESTENPFRLVTDWRQTNVESDGILIEVRERLVISGFGRDDARTIVNIHAERERRAIKADKEIPWEKLDARPVKLSIAKRLRSRLGDDPKQNSEALLIAVERPAPEPDLPALRDPLDGSYDLVLEGATVEHRKADGRAWDLAMPEILNIAGWVLRQLPSPDAVMVGTLAASLAPATKSIAGPEYPDLVAAIGFDGKWFYTPPFQDSYSAAWSARIPLRLNGERWDGQKRIEFRVWDLDFEEHDLIGSGSISLRELSDGRGYATLRQGQISEIRFRLVRRGN